MATRKKNLLAEAKEINEQLIEEIDERIEYLNGRLAIYDKIKAERDKLQSARRALLGGSRMTGAGGTQLRQEDIVAFMKENPDGVTPSMIAEKYNVKQPTVSSALYRGKNERYLNKDGMWFLRDPKAGINTVEDLD